MKTLPVVAEESLKAVMDEVFNEVAKLLAEPPAKEERTASSVFFGTMVKTVLDITERMELSSEEQEDILTACGTWVDISLLEGRSPRLLVDILKKANPKIERFTPPEWFGEKDRAVAEVDEILRGESGKQQ